MTRIINKKLSPGIARILGLLPFGAVLMLYVISSGIRLHENPNDKLLPSFGAMWSALSQLAFTPDVRTGNYLLWADTLRV